MAGVLKPDFSFETAAIARGACRVVGVDEVGRGPLAGPVTAAAVWIDPQACPEGLNDSKKLTGRAREQIFDILMQTADVSIAHASVAEIDEINILQASFLAMRRAIAGLQQPADYLLIDGNRAPSGLTVPAETIVKGDARALSIAAASIVAKVARDRIMCALAESYPGYGWEKNAGYPTPVHKKALLDLGVTPHHRQSFRPVHNILYPEKSLTA
ncbi:ribonuclease HII [Pseudoruegeria sp. SK021]|uniref:ribonuclease HII n=1 Tax=Pseudoruegeria sp. SK021 TaxID=1933035 RepID=UPI000A25B9D8|nr:ribonuclease HII [Pseudoruegeria sp. SK021]OSP54651.1 ribonuclease HII [Pseudoruegeria sp. SK021]